MVVLQPDSTRVEGADWESYQYSGRQGVPSVPEKNRDRDAAHGSELPDDDYISTL